MFTENCEIATVFQEGSQGLFPSPDEARFVSLWRRITWRRVEGSIHQLATEKNVQIADAAEGMPMIVGAILLNQGVMSTAQYELMQKLRLLFHETERTEPDSITPENAAEYVGLALRLGASLDLKENQQP